MNIKIFYFGNLIDYKKHNSSILNLPASIVVLIAFLLPLIMGSINTNLAYFASLAIFAIGILEKKSQMVKLYAFQLCLLSFFSNIFLSVCSLLSALTPIIGFITSCLSLIIAFVMIFVFFYSLYRSSQYKGWKIPFVIEIIKKYFIKDLE